MSISSAWCARAVSARIYIHRLNVIALTLPPLRERREDIPLLVNHFLRQFSQENNRPLGRFTPPAMKLLMEYSWPGNVRELENVVERAVVLSTREEFDVDLLPESILTRGMLGDARLRLSELLNSLARAGNSHASRWTACAVPVSNHGAD